jgi:hypothetical protein
MNSLRSGIVATWLGAVIACSGGSGGGGTPPGGDPGGCTPRTTCAASWCGPHPDGCGGTLACTETCGGADVCAAFVSGYCASCTADGFCADTPDLFKGGYSSVFGTSATDVWAVELDDAIFEWSGAAWQDRTSTALVAEGRAPNGPERVWGVSPTKLWGVSSWGIFRWNGVAWSFVEGRFGPMYGISGTAETDVWAVGESGRIIHYDGSGWTEKTSGTSEVLLDVWATSTSDAWAVGQNGVLLRWNGTAWTRPYPVSTVVDFRAVQPIGANEALVLTDGGELARWSGSELVSWAPGQAGFAWDFWAFAADDVWRVGDSGSIAHWDGASWTTYDGGTTATLSGVWGAPNGDVWVAASDNQVLRLRAAQEIVALQTPSPPFVVSPP